MHKETPSTCEVCQVVNPPKAPYKCHIEPYPIPPYLMDHVAIDCFAMPQVTFEGQTFDTMVVCVDRESGWIVATPHLDKGLTGEKVAKSMYKH